MISNEQKAQIARENGARSKGPVTEQGKACSRRNAITHGRRAKTLTPFVPPDSSVLSNEDRQNFFRLYDQNLAKYNPTDFAEQAIVRQITDLQWVAFRLTAARNDVLNRELEMHAPNNDPGSATAIAYESATRLKSMDKLGRELTTNLRLIIQLERRLHFVQKTWPSPCPEWMDSERERTAPQAPPESVERTNADSPQPVETPGKPLADGTMLVQCDAARTDDAIALYSRVYPDRGLTLRFPPQNDGAQRPIGTE